MSRPRSVLIALAVGCAVLAFSGCGGRSTHYSFKKTEKCLKQAGAKVDPGTADEVAANAPEGGLGVTFPNNFVSLGFNQTVSEAKDLEKQYETSGATQSVVKRKGTVVLAWDNDPSSDEQDRVESCLKPA